mgnify:FL=1
MFFHEFFVAFCGLQNGGIPDADMISLNNLPVRGHFPTKNGQNQLPINPRILKGGGERVERTPFLDFFGLKSKRPDQLPNVLAQLFLDNKYTLIMTTCLTLIK